jgi:hypothetical protein
LCRTLKAKTSYFVANSDGVKRKYTYSDRLRGYGCSKIPSPEQSSMINFFINGVLQPNATYKVVKGELILKSIDIPPIGTPLILQFITFKQKKKYKFMSRKAAHRKISKKKGGHTMPVPYLKLVLTATNTVGGNVNVNTTTNVATNVHRYSATVIALMILGGNTTIPATSFVDDAGNPVPAGGLVVPTSGFYNVYINGVLQHGGLSTLTTNNLVIATPVLLGVTVVLEVEDFSGTTSTSTATNNITVSTTINT